MEQSARFDSFKRTGGSGPFLRRGEILGSGKGGMTESGRGHWKRFSCQREDRRISSTHRSELEGLARKALMNLWTRISQHRRSNSADAVFNIATFDG